MLAGVVVGGMNMLLRFELGLVMEEIAVRYGLGYLGIRADCPHFSSSLSPGRQKKFRISKTTESQTLVHHARDGSANLELD